MAQATATDVLAQLHVAGLLPYCREIHVDETSVSGVAHLDILDRLRHDKRFYEDIWNFLHPEIPEPRTGFRAYVEGGLSAFGAGSLQLVICTLNGQFHCDIDPHNTQDVENIFGHLFGAVIPGWFKKVFGRRA